MSFNLVQKERLAKMQKILAAEMTLKKGRLAKNGYSLSFAVTFCCLLSFIVTRFETCCHLLYYLLSFFFNHCHLLYQSLSLVGPLVVVTCSTTRCTTRCHSLSLDVTLVFIFINDPTNWLTCIQNNPQNFSIKIFNICIFNLVFAVLLIRYFFQIHSWYKKQQIKQKQHYQNN